MIVKAMNSKEIMNEIAKDYPTVMKKANYLTESLRREAVKSKNKCVHRVFDYKSQRQNNWIIITHYYVDDPTFTVLLHYLDDHGLNGIIVSTDNQTLFHYNPHFLERYNERYLNQPNISKKDLLKHYAFNNAVSTLQIEKDMDSGIERFFSRSREGVGLGLVEKVQGVQNLIYHYKTFISNTMIFRSQDEIFDIAGREYEKYWNENFSKTRISAFSLAS